MRSTLTVSLPKDLSRDLNVLAKRTGQSRSRVIQDALRRQIALERFRSLRKSLVPKGTRRGFVTDEDVFKSVS